MEFLTFDKAMEIGGFIIGLLYLYWEYRANRLLWLAGLLMPCMSMWVYFRAGLYADFTMNIYYLVMAIYGLLAWTGRDKARKSAEETPKSAPLRISRFPLSRLAPILAATTAIYLFIAWVLITFTNSTVPWLDALTTALSMVATWMLARKYVEQWLVWTAVDIISSGLYFYKGIPLYGILYAIYTAIAILGYRKWLRLMHSGH
ncbi:MAG: nicotinamide riboside transporter PnuC [Muribaculaceae bacterium]|nr:nicotinamide riboside transporter PnuC [Muribaculaceae bacterium]